MIFPLDSTDLDEITASFPAVTGEGTELSQS